MSLCSCNITIAVSELKPALRFGNNNRLIGSQGQLFDNLFVYKDQR